MNLSRSLAFAEVPLDSRTGQEAVPSLLPSPVPHAHRLHAMWPLGFSQQEAALLQGAFGFLPRPLAPWGSGERLQGLYFAK